MEKNKTMPQLTQKLRHSKFQVTYWHQMLGQIVSFELLEFRLEADHKI